MWPYGPTGSGKKLPNNKDEPTMGQYLRKS